MTQNSQKEVKGFCDFCNEIKIVTQYKQPGIDICICKECLGEK